MSKRAAFHQLIGAVVFCAAAWSVQAQQPQINPEVYSQLGFRYIGPVGNRTTAVVGVPGNPNVYYVGAASGGIFKSTDGGVHWDPVFDAEPVSSIGSLALAQSDPNTSSAATSRSAMGSTNRWTQVRPGRTWAWRGPVASRMS